MQDRYRHLDENPLQRTAGPYIGSQADMPRRPAHVGFTPESGLKSDIAPCPKSANIVAKVENRTTLEISRKLISRPLCYCLAIQRRYEGPWSILDESIWSLTSPRVQRISGSKKFRSPPQKDFCNNICQFRTHAPQQICPIRHLVATA